ncbi:hypothetical protein WICPIJ_002702 [Wickerhamomyces pijperi]|uniref:Uncharacterized protein n=1 Tax=Wickerhamomyces pijperi TaxID=599730 RepID=A0A9P8QB06_WICPI|nr:hypothetical protein WICPIJ_002702 [Wickerhamomyces pijperi]
MAGNKSTITCLSVSQLDVVLQQVCVLQFGVGDSFDGEVSWLGLLGDIGELPLVVISQQFHGTGTVPHTGIVWVSSDSDNSSTTQACEFLILELLGNQPWNQITTGTLTSA